MDLPAFQLEATVPPLENDKRHCHNQKFSAVSNVLAFTLKAKALIKQLKELDYKSMNVSGQVSLCHCAVIKDFRESARDWAEHYSCIFKQWMVKTGPKTNK